MPDYDGVDRPPAGTECVECRARGHFCPAVLWVGLTDLGICQPCRDGSDCPRFKVMHSEPVLFEPDPVGSASSPAKTIPPEQWPEDTAIHEQRHDPKDVPFGLRNIVKAEQNGLKILLPAPQSSLQDIPVRDRVPRNSGGGRASGTPYKTEKRELAKALLLEGNSVRKAAAIAGISTSTVRLAREEIPAEQLPPPAPRGFHAHQKQQEYMQRENAVTDKTVQPARSGIPKPEEVLKLAAELVEARTRLAELEALWESIFALR